MNSVVLCASSVVLCEILSSYTENHREPQRTTEKKAGKINL